MSDKLTSAGLGKDPVRSKASHRPATLQYVKDRCLSAARSEAGSIIYAKWSREKQQNAALGLLSTDETNTVKADIQVIRGECNDSEVAINACIAENINDITEAEKQEVYNASNVVFTKI